jgi:hypothetical protein
MRLLFSALLTPLVLASLTYADSLARTWYITTDGLGDAPNIEAGVDSAVAGDTVLVGPGTFEVYQVHLKNGVTLTSENGPNYTRITPPFQEYPSYAVACEDAPSRTEISGFWFDGFRWIRGAIWISFCTDLVVRNNVFTGNEHGIQLAPLHYQHSFVYIESNTFVNNDYLAIEGQGQNGQVTNNIVYDPVNLHSFSFVSCNCFLDTSPIGNFQADPQFCGPPGSLYLQSDSPCAPGNAPLPFECGLIGALPVGCDTVHTEPKTWGVIKAIYR